MRILEDGNVEIRNKNTGEVKVVRPQELPSYGIDYTTYNQQLEAYNEAFNPQIKTEPDLKEKEVELNEIESLARSIINQSQSGKNVSGLATGTLPNLGLVQKIAPGWTGDVTKMRSLASQLTAARAFGEGGKSFTETERALLSGQLPRIEEVTPRRGIRGAIFGGYKGQEGQVLDTEKQLAEKMEELLGMVERKRESYGIGGKDSKTDPLGLL